MKNYNRQDAARKRLITVQKYIKNGSFKKWGSLGGSPIIAKYKAGLLVERKRKR
jgi:hypothetical protein